MSGQKDIETRAYPIPEHFLGKYLAIIETGTSGLSNKGLSKVIALVRIDSCFQYSSQKQWLKDFPHHRVSQADRAYGFSKEKEKWAWEIKHVLRVCPAVPPPKIRGIKYAKRCSIPTSSIQLGETAIEELVSRCIQY